MGIDHAHHNARGAQGAATPLTSLTTSNTAPSVSGPSEVETETEKHDFQPRPSPVRHDYAGVPLGRIPTSQDTLSGDGQGGDGEGNQREALSAVQSERRGSKVIISFMSDDPEHPNNWPVKKKMLVFIGGIMSVVNSTLGSSLPANAVPWIVEDFGVTNDLQFALPISCFLMGYVIGPILCGPLSENFGRKPVMSIAFLFYIIWTMACAVAPNWPALLIFRLLAGIFASAPIACVGGLYADIFSDPTSRGMAMAYFMVATTLGPVLAPAISGFIASNVSWRWVFGFGTFFALATLPFLVVMPESYLPILLSHKAKRLREETGNSNIVAVTDLQKKSWNYVITVVMTRPFRMLFQEAIVSCVCLYAMLVYSIFYLYFQSYPLVFVGPTSVYNFSPGLAGTTFLAIFVGSVAGLPLFLWWDGYLGRKQAEGKKWAKQEEYRRLPLACLGGPLFAAAIFWLGWSARSDVHWILPTLSGVPFGMAFLLIFMALLNYLSDAYLTFAASAQGMASTCRSIGAVVLPIAGRRMFMNLGIDWACSLLAFLALGVAVIPFVFIRYGDRIRDNSKFCQELKKMTDEQQEEERQEGERKRKASGRAQKEAGGQMGPGEV